MFRSDSDVRVVRTPCQRLRDHFDHSGEAHDVSGERPAVCDQILDVVAGKAQPFPVDATLPIRAAKVATDSYHRVLVSEPTTRTVHILDFANGKYTRIDGTKNDRMDFPYAIAVDGDNDLYITDLKRGMIVEYSADGKFKREIGNFKGEGEFDQPTSIAVDRKSGRIFLTDTPRHLVFILDHDGNVLARIGKRGGGDGPAEFRFPSDVTLHGNELFVLDKKNSRIQVLDLDGRYKRELKADSINSAKGMAIDAKGLIYVLLDADIAEVLNPEGKLLFRFGHYGADSGEFISSEGLHIDSADRLYVTDTGNLRVQVFQITDAPVTVSAGGSPWCESRRPDCE